MQYLKRDGGAACVKMSDREHVYQHAYSLGIHELFYIFLRQGLKNQNNRKKDSPVNFSNIRIPYSVVIYWWKWWCGHVPACPCSARAFRWYTAYRWTARCPRGACCRRWSWPAGTCISLPSWTTARTCDTGRWKIRTCRGISEAHENKYTVILPILTQQTLKIWMAAL